MKEVRLIKLALKDFQGGSFVLDTNNSNCSVMGANSTGKTRLFSAFTFLISGKDSTNKKDFEIKNIKPDGGYEHGLEHTAEMSLDIDGEIVVLKKVFKEKWVKSRGHADATFSGHSTQHYINGIPKSETEYKSYIVEMAGNEETFRLLTSPSAFADLPWQRQRELLLDVCGDISDADVIASDANLAELPGILGKRALEDHRKIIISRRTEINKELEKIPVRIDEQRRSLPDITGLDPASIQAEIARIDTEINSGKLGLQGVDMGVKIADLTKKLAVINADLLKMESIHYSERMKTVNAKNQQISEITERLRSVNYRIKSIKGEIDRVTVQLNHILGDLDGLRLKWSEIDAQTFQDSTEDTCKACGQSLPAERVQAAREKACAAFNADKAERLKDIDAKGAYGAEKRDNLKTSLEAMQNERETLEKSIAGLPDLIDNLNRELGVEKQFAKDFSQIPGYNELYRLKIELDAEIQAEKGSHTADKEKILSEIAILDIRRKASKLNADKFASREAGEKRISALKDEEKALASEYERLEKQIYLMEQFVRIKVSLLTERINGKFELARFKLFELQVNGALADCCEITVNGVPYNGGLNNAAKINAGLDVCRTLAQHFGLMAPIFIDNAESVCELIAMNAQMIRLVVSEKDDVLRIEVAA